MNKEMVKVCLLKFDIYKWLLLFDFCCYDYWKYWVLVVFINDICFFWDWLKMVYFFFRLRFLFCEMIKWVIVKDEVLFKVVWKNRWFVFEVSELLVVCWGKKFGVLGCGVIYV